MTRLKLLARQRRTEVEIVGADKRQDLCPHLWGYGIVGGFAAPPRHKSGRASITIALYEPLDLSRGQAELSVGFALLELLINDSLYQASRSTSR